MKTVYFDVDTQIDFLFPAGALYVPGAELLIPRIAALNYHAGANSIPLISTADAHTENDPEFRHWPPHCVSGTVGQLRPESALLSNRTGVPNRPMNEQFQAQQLIVEKVVFDPFSNPNLGTILDSLQAERYVVYGVVTEICVRYAVDGLLRRGGARVELVTDAVRSLNEEASNVMFREFQAAGGILTAASDVLA